mgnify:CR=1 FL=1
MDMPNLLANRLAAYIFCLQVVDSPESKDNCSDDTTKGEDEDWGITTIKGCSYSVTHFLSVAATRSRALRAAKSWALFLKIHTSAFQLQNRFC